MFDFPFCLGYDFHGPVANAAARIEHIGYGGQTLISSAVCSLLSEEEKKECDLKAVGAM
jgi:class 3 adenylate cyclase